MPRWNAVACSRVVSVGLRDRWNAVVSHTPARNSGTQAKRNSGLGLPIWPTNPRLAMIQYWE